MNNLYYVVTYHHSNNVKARTLVTAVDKRAAERLVLSGCGDAWRVEHSMLVCVTPENVYLEV